MKFFRNSEEKIWLSIEQVIENEIAVEVIRLYPIGCTYIPTCCDPQPVYESLSDFDFMRLSWSKIPVRFITVDLDGFEKVMFEQE